jgi:hypothetical protein
MWKSRPPDPKSRSSLSPDADLTPERCRVSRLDVLSKDTVGIAAGLDVSKEDVACYRLYAANCVELAERVSDTDRRLFMLRMAQAWARLADQVEKNELNNPDETCIDRSAAKAGVIEGRDRGGPAGLIPQADSGR